ncbi:hypothetical protein CONPUDRAFT_158863 [Coniophora puteana RWD-64-598 SS2]|uniref:GST N-terminal domain-containing protein n=1 Tax=Coniophora puteana (strain RWD-64-598) TaxID=741705 RepID=A0A5M3M9C2_CONPW|nr:uncharacterized protein CONPUDRAFT_158863 [Coniophora puteana RWD-64-598 SS2]EIW75400.1 hypothetical protein CONPUDRAFT_158863 [Coniophora puteana RWD-64-598 SS2]
MPEKIVFYKYGQSPFGQRVAIAFLEAQIPHESCEVDVWNKPTWFVEKVNTIGKIPAITYGSPSVPHDQPSVDAFKLGESLLILEFLTDLYPSSGLLPSDPVQRAQARFFIDTAEKLPLALIGWFIQGASWHGIIDMANALQALLPQPSKFAVGDNLTIADIAIMPFFALLRLVYENGIGAYPAKQAQELKWALEAPELARFKAYVDNLLARPSMRAVFDEEATKEYLRNMVAMSLKP